MALGLPIRNPSLSHFVLAVCYGPLFELVPEDAAENSHAEFFEQMDVLIKHLTPRSKLQDRCFAMVADVKSYLNKCVKGEKSLTEKDSLLTRFYDHTMFLENIKAGCKRYCKPVTPDVDVMLTLLDAMSNYVNRN